MEVGVVWGGAGGEAPYINEVCTRRGGGLKNYLILQTKSTDRLREMRKGRVKIPIIFADIIKVWIHRVALTTPYSTT